MQVFNKIHNFVKDLKNQMNMRENNFVVIREYDSVNDAEWNKSILEGEGVWATIQNELMSTIYPIGAMPAQLVVRQEEKKRAEEILEAYSN